MKKGFFQGIEAKYQQFQESEFAKKVGPKLRDIAIVLGMTSKWTYKLRSLVLSIPVAVIALALAVRNLAQLPAQVGINMMTNGQYQFMISRGVLVCFPLALTAASLCMMLLSKKMTYPWLISVFSLMLPVAIGLISAFPG